MYAGDIETGVDHLSNAVAVCGQPQQLLGVLQQTLPPQVFQMLLMKLPVAGQVRDVNLDVVIILKVKKVKGLDIYIPPLTGKP